MSLFYRVVFGANLILPIYEILDIPNREPFEIGWPDGFMFLLIILSVTGFVLVDIRDRLPGKRATKEP